VAGHSRLGGAASGLSVLKSEVGRPPSAPPAPKKTTSTPPSAPTYRRCLEPLPADLKQLGRGGVFDQLGSQQDLLIEGAQAMLQHGSVALVAQGGAQVDAAVGIDADEVGVEGGVVELAQRQAVVGRGDALFFAVADDVGGVEQLAVAQATDGTALFVGHEHAITKLVLVQAGPGAAHGIAAVEVGSTHGRVQYYGVGLVVFRGQGLDGEGQFARQLVGDHADDGFVARFDDALEVDDGQPRIAAAPQGDVVGRKGIGALVAVEKCAALQQLAVVVARFAA
jgi:hypothetical protein